MTPSSRILEYLRPLVADGRLTVPESSLQDFADDIEKALCLCSAGSAQDATTAILAGYSVLYGFDIAMTPDGLSLTPIGVAKRYAVIGNRMADSVAMAEGPNDSLMIKKA